jgi:hypothetical protein
MAKPPPAECPGCGQNIRRVWRMKGEKTVGTRFRDHSAPCGLPCKTKYEAGEGEVTHTITEECTQCNKRVNLYQEAMNKAYVNGVVYDKSQDPRKHPGTPREKTPPQPPEPKVPWNNIIIPPHVLKMVKIRAGFTSVIDAADMIERLYPLTCYESSQKKAHGTSHTKRTKPGKNKRKSQRVDLYVVTDNEVKWTFYMKRNVLMTVHRNDDLDNIGARPALQILDETG